MNWYRIIEWFGDLSERRKLISDFNKSAKYAFIAGVAPTLLRAETTRGNSSYKHEFSRWLSSGFRIEALDGKNLTRDELKDIGRVILDNAELTRKLVALGWDTLEVKGGNDNYGLQWELKKFARMGLYLNQLNNED